MNRLCIFAHYDKDNMIDDHVLYLLEKLKNISTFNVFVTASAINKHEIDKLTKLCNKIILRDNAGYDFVSWQTGMNSMSNNVDFDEILLCNDSVYGPLYPLTNIFDTMSSKECDFWGMTDNYEIAYHLQSYFLVFKKNIVNSEVFKEFWNEVKIESNKHDIIKKYKVGLSQCLISVGFKPCAYLPTSLLTSDILRIKAISTLKNPLKTAKTILFKSKKKVLNYRALNPTHYLWKDLIVKYKVPFLKIELLRDNPNQINIEGYSEIIKRYSDYDTNLIKKHLERVK